MHQLLPFVAFEKGSFVWGLYYFCQMSLALQLSNHGWHNDKFLISPLTMFQQLCQTYHNTFATFGEGLWKHIEYFNLSWIHRAQAKETHLKNVIDWIIFSLNFLKLLVVCNKNAKPNKDIFLYPKNLEYTTRYNFDVKILLCFD